MSNEAPYPAAASDGHDQADILHVCRPKRLPSTLWEKAAHDAVRIEPRNATPMYRAFRVQGGVAPQLSVAHLAVMTDRRWQTAGVHLTVSFLDNPETALRQKILRHMNAWSRTANVRFSEVRAGGAVRIIRTLWGDAGGYWSYLGTEIRQIAPREPTMSLEGFRLETPPAEFFRVVRHETGHTLGFPHEHLRQELVDRIDRDKAIAHFHATDGWTREEVIAQVLTPLDPNDLLQTGHADPDSIMCYEIPGSITKDGKPIVGGSDIDDADYAFAALIYPKTVGNHAAVPPPGSAGGAGAGAVGRAAPGSTPPNLATLSEFFQTTRDLAALLGGGLAAAPTPSLALALPTPQKTVHRPTFEQARQAVFALLPSCGYQGEITLDAPLMDFFGQTDAQGDRVGLPINRTDLLVERLRERLGSIGVTPDDLRQGRFRTVEDMIYGICS